MLRRILFGLLALTGVLSAAPPARAAEVTEYYHLDTIGNVRVITDAG